MIKKAIISTLIFLFIFNTLISNTNFDNHDLCKPVKLKSNDGEEIETYVLCLTEKGLVTWNSSVYYNSEDLAKYAMYYTYDEIEYLKLGGKFQLGLLGVGAVLSAIMVQSYNPDPETPMDFRPVIFVLVMGVSLILSFFTMFIPRTYREASLSGDKKLLPKDHYLFKDEIPIELHDFIKLHE